MLKEFLKAMEMEHVTAEKVKGVFNPVLDFMHIGKSLIMYNCVVQLIQLYNISLFIHRSRQPHMRSSALNYEIFLIRISTLIYMDNV